MSETVQETRNTPKPKKSSGFLSIIKKSIALLFLLAFAGSVAWGFWSYKMYQDAKNQINQLTSLDGQQELAQQEIDKVLDRVRIHMLLPDDEEPVMATVVDAQSLAQEQDFYKDASNGDRVIVYQKAQKAILYNPDKDIIVNVGPIFLDETQPAAESTTETSVKTTEPVSETNEEEETTEEPASE
jgi:hypothetical protein